MTRVTNPPVSFADLAFESQGLQLDPTARAAPAAAGKNSNR